LSKKHLVIATLHYRRQQRFSWTVEWRWSRVYCPTLACVGL